MGGRFSQFFGVDVYADHHNTREYLEALRSIGILAPYKLLRMKFAEALELFDDESIDFVYIDGYAHTGEDGGRTIFDWLPKVKIGGLLAGHDYHPDWPLVVEAVDALCAATGFELLVTEVTPDGGPYDSYPSWAVVKTRSVELARSTSDLARRAAEARAPSARDPLDQPFAQRARAAARLLLGTRGMRLVRRLEATAGARAARRSGG